MSAVTHMLFAGRGSAAFSPASIANCALWIRADLGVTLVSGDVSVWADQSGNGRDFSQSTAGNRPTYQATGGPNSTPTINFTGATPDSMQSASFALNQTFHAFWAGKGTNVGGDGCGIGNNSGGNRQDIWDVGSSNRWLVYAGGTQTSVTATHGVNHMFEYLCSGASSVMRLDGTSGSTFNPGSNNFNSGIALGNNSVLNAASITLAELVIYSAAISGANLTALRSYFATRYGLST